MFAQPAYRRLLAGLLVATIALSGCFGSEQDAAAGPSCDRPDAAFQSPATRLTFRVQDGGRAELQRAQRILCERLDGIGVEHRVGRISDNRLTVDVPRDSALAHPSGNATSFGIGQLVFYDWEANVVGPDGVPAPRDASVTGGLAAGEAGAISIYAAVLRAAKRPAATEPDNARTASRFYAVDPKERRVFAAGASTAPQLGSPTRAEALATVPARLRDAAKIYEVKPDTVIVRAERATGNERGGAWYVLRDDVALRGSAIANPQQRFDEGPGTDGRPIVTFDFSAEGRASWLALTRELADRGAAAVGLSGGPDADANQHFAVVVDDQLLSVPYIDFRLNPGGIDPAQGSQISGAFTIASARELAVLLASDPLPAPLVLDERRDVP